MLKYGLPNVRNLIVILSDLKAYNQALAEIANFTKDENVLKMYALAMVEIAQTYGKNATDALCHGIFTIKDQIKNVNDLKACGVAFADIVNTYKDVHLECVFRYGLPLLKAQIKGINDLKTYSLALSEIFKAAHGHDWHQWYDQHWCIFRQSLPAVKDLIERFGIKPFVEIAKVSKKNTFEVFQYGLPVIKHLIDKFGIEPFIEIARIFKEQTSYVLQYGLIEVEPEIRSVAELLKKDLLLQGLQKAHSRLREPYTETIEEEEVYYVLYDKYYGVRTRTEYRDPDQFIRTNIDQAIKTLQDIRQ